MKIKMTIGELVTVNPVIDQILKTKFECNDDYSGKDLYQFNYALIRNKKAIQTVLKTVDVQLKKFELERISLCEEFSEKDEKGKSIIENGNYKGIDKNPSFVKGYEELDKRLKDYLLTEIEFDCYGIPEVFIPVGLLGTFQETIDPFIISEDKFQSKKQIINGNNNIQVGAGEIKLQK
jgi:hypothetical protein